MTDDEALALAGIAALEDLIRKAGLPTSLRELGFGEEEKKILPEIAGSCSISSGALRMLDSAEILEIYEECW